MAAAAGPLAIVVAVVEAVKMLKENIQGEIHAVGEVTASFASLKGGAERLDEFGDGLNKASDKLTWISPALGLLAGVAGESAKSVATLDRAVKGTADKLAQYDGRLANQQALQENQELLRDINRAHQFGEATGDANAARFGMEQKIADLTDKAIPAAMKLAENAFNAVAGIVVILEAIADPIIAIAGNSDVQAAASIALNAALPQVMIPLNILVALGRNAAAANNDNVANQFLVDFLGAARQPAPDTVQPAAPRPGPAIGLP